MCHYNIIITDLSVIYSNFHIFWEGSIANYHAYIKKVALK